MNFFKVWISLEMAREKVNNEIFSYLTTPIRCWPQRARKRGGVDERDGKVLVGVGLGMGGPFSTIFFGDRTVGKYIF